MLFRFYLVALWTEQLEEIKLYNPALICFISSFNFCKKVTVRFMLLISQLLLRSCGRNKVAEPRVNSFISLNLSTNFIPTTTKISKIKTCLYINSLNLLYKFEYPILNRKQKIPIQHKTKTFMYKIIKYLAV